MKGSVASKRWSGKASWAGALSVLMLQKRYASGEHTNYTMTLHIYIFLGAICNDNLNGPYAHVSVGSGPPAYPVSVQWKEVPVLFWPDEKREILFTATRKQCGAKIWSKNSRKSGRGWDYLPTGITYRSLSEPGQRDTKWGTSPDPGEPFLHFYLWEKVIFACTF